MPSIAGRHRLRDFGAAMVGELEAGRILAVDDVDSDPRTASPDTRRAFGDLSVRAVLDVPLIKEGRLLAILVILAGRSRTWTPTDRELARDTARSEEQKSELQSLMRISYAVLCLQKKNKK